MKTCVLVVSLFAIAGPVAAAAGPSDSAHGAPSRATCPGAAPMQTRDQARKAPREQLHRLDQLPPAAHLLTVLKTVDGCGVVVVKVGEQTYDVPQGGTRRITPLDVTRRMP